MACSRSVCDRRVRAALTALTLLALTSGPAPAQESARVHGLVTSTAGEPLPFASVRVVHHPLGTIADAEGRFEVAAPAGPCTLEVSSVGYRTRRLPAVAAAAAEPVAVILQPEPIALSGIVVTPGAFVIMQGTAGATQTLTRQDIHSLPQLGEDIYRAVKRLPGVSSNDFSAKFTVRGGEHEEVLVQLDGLELYEPFHLKDIHGGALSIVDVAAIDGIDMRTGGFGAAYGNRMSGVFDIRTLQPAGEARTSVGVSLMNARFMTQGGYADGRGSWLLSARRGYLDVVLTLMGEQNFDPTYWDLLGKTEYDLSDDQRLSVHVLQASDRLSAVQDEDGDRIGSRYGNRYLWLRLRSTWSGRLTSHSVLSSGSVNRERGGEDFELFWRFRDGVAEQLQRLQFDVDETRDVRVAGLKQDWSFEWTPRRIVDWGFDARRLSADYDYSNHVFGFADVDGQVEDKVDSVRVRLRPDGHSLGLYASTRLRLTEALTVEAGGRYDRVSYTGDRDLSPRLSAAWSLAQRTVLRAGWGHYRQAQGIDELAVPFDDTRYHPSQRAEHRVVGLEHRFASGVHLRLEGYDKALTDVRPRYEPLNKDVLFFPELEDVVAYLEPDRGQARGIELYVRRDTGGALTWWTSYALAQVRERFDDDWVPKGTDQRHTFYVDANYRPSRRWSLNVAWQIRSGWPYSERTFVPAVRPQGDFPFEASYGPRHAARLPVYHRLDVRVSRHFAFRGGRASVFLEAINLYDRGNVVQRYPRDVSWDGVSPGPVLTGHFDEEWLPLMPSAGFRWDF